MAIYLTGSEKETIICFNEAESTAEFFTYASRFKRQLAELATERPEDVQLLRTLPEGAVEYRLPKKWLRVRPNRVLNDEQRERYANAAKARFGKNDGTHLDATK